jgi:serine/threonine-protein kinase HipA
MVNKVDVIKVVYKDLDVGALSFDPSTGQSAFMYMPEFVRVGIELSPLMMPLRENYIYNFNALNPETFKGLPGMLADSLPDDFGNRILNVWLASKGRVPNSITPIERLRYTGMRGMGALEFRPAEARGELNANESVQIDELVAIAQEVLYSRNEFDAELKADGSDDQEAMLSLLSVGTSAGGARPKAVLAFNENFSKVRSGQANVPNGYTHYLMKFDGVTERNTNKETFGDPLGYGAMEYVYYQMATACGIDMMPCHLLNEGDRQHFVTQRYDRIGNEKLHVQTLNALAHVDYKMPGSFSYEELFLVLRELKMTAVEADQILKRMIFNIVARNHDDHAKNFSFILRNQKWELAPAYDLAFSYKPGSIWVDSHWMSLNGKRKDYVLEDILSVTHLSRKFTHKYVLEVLNHTIEVVSGWKSLAKGSNVPDTLIKEVSVNLRLKF